MSSWKDQIQAGPASFRGASFFVQTSEFSGGRRTVKHEYPLRDAPYFEDMGRKARAFTVEGFVLGDDYLSARDALITALETEGPGSLVHPYYGTRTVAVAGDFRVRETATEGGAAFFSIPFAETPVQPAQPTTVPDAVGQLAASATAALQAVSSNFTALYVPGPHLDSLSAAVRAASNAVSDALQTVSLESQTLAGIQSQLTGLTSNLTALVSSPASLLASFQNLVSSFGAGSEGLLFALYSFNPGVRLLATTPSRIQEQQNFDAIQQLVQRACIIQLATLAPLETYDSYEAAVKARDAIAALIDAQAESTTDDTFPALLQLRANLVQAVPGDSSDLPQLVTYTPPQSVASLVLAYRLYGDVALEPDLIARNGIPDPGFVPGGIALEVLGDG